MCSFTLDTLEIACFEYFKTIHFKFSSRIVVLYFHKKGDGLGDIFLRVKDVG